MGRISTSPDLAQRALKGTVRNIYTPGQRQFSPPLCTSCLMRRCGPGGPSGTRVLQAGPAQQSNRVQCQAAPPGSGCVPGSGLELLWPCGDPLVPPHLSGQPGQPSSSEPLDLGLGEVVVRTWRASREASHEEVTHLAQAAPPYMLENMACGGQSSLPYHSGLLPWRPGPRQVTTRRHRHHGQPHTPLLSLGQRRSALHTLPNHQSHMA